MKTIRIALKLCFVIAMTQLTAVAQKPDEWTRFQANGTEFSIEMPRNAELFADKDGFTVSDNGSLSGIDLRDMRMLCASDDSTVMWLEVFSANDAPRAMRIMVSQTDLDPVKLANLPKGFSGNEVSKTGARDFARKQDVPISFVSRYYASKQNLYIVTAARRGAKNEAFDRFLNSVRFNEWAASGMAISSVKAFSIEDIGVVAAKPATNAIVPAKSADQKPDEDTSGLLILMRARVPYTSLARSNNVTGTVLLRATFQTNGRVSKIELIEGLPGGLNRSAFFVTVRTKYLPPEKSGVAESITRQISFSFSIY